MTQNRKGGIFPSLIDFKEVIEVLFEEGRQLQEIDHSKTVAGLRNQVDAFSKSLQSRDGMSEAIRK